MSQYASSLPPNQSPAWPLVSRGLHLSAPAQLSIWTVTNAFWVPLLAIAMRLVSSPTANASYAIIAAYALAGPRQAIVALYLCWLFNMINHGIAPIAGYAAILRHVVILCAFVSVVIHSRRATYAKSGWLVPITGVLCGFLIVHSMLFSHQTDVSVLKAISFSLTVSALALGWPSLGDRDRQLVESFLFGSLGVIAVASIPFVASPIGYYRNGKGFQGVLVHPQNFGPSMAVLAALLAAQSLSDRRVRPWKAVVFGLAVVFIILSKARIGAMALLVGMAFGIVGEIIRSWIARQRSSNPLRKQRLVIASVVVLLGALAAAPWLSSLLSEFLQKGARGETLSEVAMASRGAKIEDMMRNIQEHPVFGVGFGALLGDDYFLIQRDPVFGLPVMATVEKGVLPIAIVEETGFIGALVTYPWLLLLLVRSVRGGVVPGSVFWSVLATNIAEACLFSPGGQGMFQLIFAIWAATSPPVAAKQFTHHQPVVRRAA